MANHNLSRLRTGDMEIGYTEALERHVSRHVVPPPPVSQRRLDFEHSRPRILRECMAEATGVFFYVFPGIAAVASLYVNTTNPLGVAVFGSLFNIGWGFAIGIAFAIITCAPVSGGHFNPAITLCFATFQGFPWKKVPHYILSQIFGAFVAGLLCVGMYWEEVNPIRLEILAAGGELNSASGPGFILCAFPNPNQSLGYLFFIEFFVDSFIAIVIWACLDPANPFVSPQSAPFTIGLAYAVMVWGFANQTISTNMARDLGTRMAAAVYFGPSAFTYKNYSWISILVNIPATFFGVGYYEFLMRDSLKKISLGHAEHEDGEEGLIRHLTNKGGYQNGANGDMERGYTTAVDKHSD